MPPIAALGPRERVVHVRIGNEELELDWDAWEQRVREGRVPPEALVRFEAVTGAAWRRADQLEMYRSLADSSAAAFARHQARSAPPWLTALLVGVQVRIYLLAQLPPVGDWLEAHWTKWTAPTLEQAQLWRPVTMGFLHTSLGHVLMNLVWLGYTAWHLERALGWRNLLVLYLASVTGGSLLSMVGAPDSPSLGASGGVFGLIAASVVFGLSRPELLPERSRRFFGFALLPYLLIMLLSGMTNSGTDNWAHLGGLITGGLLASFADPPGFERQRGWTTRWQVGALGALAAVLLVLGVTGPRIELLRPVQEARAVALMRRNPEAAARLGDQAAIEPLQFAVPAGWGAARDVTGESAWAAPLAGRTWSVREEVLGAPATPDDLLARWLARLERDGWTYELGERTPDLVGGRPGVRVPISIGRPAAEPEAAPEQMEITWRGAVRGLRAVIEVWQVEPRLAARLAPLHARLQASVTWDDPAELVDAAARHARSPSHLDSRRRYATALASVGEVAEALALQEGIVAEVPTSRKDWQALLRTATWYPDGVDGLDGLLQRALDADLGPRITVAVADVLDAAGRPDSAVGLLRLAYAQAPGERTLGRALTSRGRSDALHPSAGLPLAAWWDLDAERPRAPEQVRALLDAPLDLAHARQVGEAEAAARARLAARIAREVDAGLAEVVGSLALLASGHPALDAAVSLGDVRHGLKRAADGDPPAWWHPSLPAVPRLRAMIDPLPDEAALPRVPVVRAG